MSTQQFPEVPKRWIDLDEHVFKISQAVRGLMIGETNNVLEVTLRPNETTTIIQDRRISRTSKPFLTAMSASAAAAAVWHETMRGKITLHHDADPAADRTFGVLFCG